jgi:hypothetical protein
MWMLSNSGRHLVYTSGRVGKMVLSTDTETDKRTRNAGNVRLPAVRLAPTGLCRFRPVVPVYASGVPLVSFAPAKDRGSPEAKEGQR